MATQVSKEYDYPTAKLLQYRLWFTVQTPAQSLSKSHKQLLLPVPPDDKIETADEIKDMSYRDARAWIKSKYKPEYSWLRYFTVWKFAEFAA